MSACVVFLGLAIAFTDLFLVMVYTSLVKSGKVSAENIGRRSPDREAAEEQPLRTAAEEESESNPEEDHSEASEAVSEEKEASEEEEDEEPPKQVKK